MSVALPATPEEIEVEALRQQVIEAARRGLRGDVMERWTGQWLAARAALPFVPSTWRWHQDAEYHALVWWLGAFLARPFAWVEALPT